jgi:hypothetical protein
LTAGGISINSFSKLGVVADAILTTAGTVRVIKDANPLSNMFSLLNIKAIAAASINVRL